MMAKVIYPILIAEWDLFLKSLDVINDKTRPVPDCTTQIVLPNEGVRPRLSLQNHIIPMINKSDHSHDIARKPLYAVSK